MWRWGFILTKVTVTFSMLDLKKNKQQEKLQYNLNCSNPDGSFTVDDSNSFFRPYKIHSKAQENKYLGIFSYFVMELDVVCIH